MRWTPLLLAVGCSLTKSQPPPAPLSVPPANAAGPADTSDGGTLDGGMPDAGQPAAPDAGPPRAVVPDGGIGRGDLVSPITAAGSETPVGLDWGEKGNQPAATLFKNVKLLGSLTGNRMMAGMQSMRANLGQKCAMCHLVEQKDFASDARKEKLRARDMIRMTEEINRRTFDGRTQVTCWMCHRGNEEPEKRPFSKELPEGFAKRHADKLDQPVEKVFHDLRILNGMNVRTFGQIMGWFSRELGVKCTHCHQETDFAADTPKKTRARQMLEMTGYLGDGRYYPKGNSPVGCGTCHQGNAVPQRTPGEKS